MSTALDDENGACIAVRYYGGRDRGPLVDVNMTQDQVEAKTDMIAIEEISTEPTTLGAWIEKQKANGYAIRYANAKGTRFQ